MTDRRCSACGEVKPIEDFPIKNKEKGWRRGRCYPCQAAYGREIRSRNPEAHRARTRAYRQRNLDKARADGRKRFYGLSPEATAAMLDAQQAQCAICTRAIHDGPDGFCVDHDHKSGRIRGLLCRKCNVLLGMAADEPSILAAAIRYLEATYDDRHEGQADSS